MPGNVGQEAISVGDSERHLCVHSLWALWVVGAAENFVLASCKGADCEDQPVLVWVVALFLVDTVWQVVLFGVLDVLVDHDLLGRWGAAQSENNLGLQGHKHLLVAYEE